MPSDESIIPEPVIAAVIGWVDLLCIIALIRLFRFRNEAHIVFRGWRAILTRSVLMLLWINLTVLGDNVAQQHNLCRFCTAALFFFYSYISSVAVQCWHTYACWISLSMIIRSQDKRTTIRKPPKFLRYRRLLTSPLFEIGLGILVMVALGASFLKTMLVSRFDVVNPDGVSMVDRCSSDTSMATSVVFGVAALALAVLSRSLHSVDNRFGLSREFGGISVSLAIAAVLVSVKPVVPSSLARVVEFFQVLTLISINLIWSICLPLYITTEKNRPTKPSKSYQKASEYGKMSTPSQPGGRCMLTPSSSLIDVLDDETGGRALFKKFCISEFSVENILWLESSSQFRSKYERYVVDQAGMPSATARPIDMGEFIDDLDSIVRGFIRADGILTLNLPAKISAAVLDYASCIDLSRAESDAALVRQTVHRGLQLIQKVDSSVMDLMKDTFSRFRSSPQYLSHIQEVSTVAIDLSATQTLPIRAARV